MKNFEGKENSSSEMFLENVPLLMETNCRKAPITYMKKKMTWSDCTIQMFQIWIVIIQHTESPWILELLMTV